MRFGKPRNQILRMVYSEIIEDTGKVVATFEKCFEIFAHSATAFDTVNIDIPQTVQALRRANTA